MKCVELYTLDLLLSRAGHRGHGVLHFVTRRTAAQSHETHELRAAGGAAEQRVAAQQRFADLLRSAPQYFKLFRRNIQVANQCGWWPRKGARESWAFLK